MADVQSPADMIDIPALLQQMHISEKIKLLGGKNFWHTEDLSHRGIPSIRLSDGPNGVRGTAFFNGVPSSCFPCATGLASSFDLAFVNEVGHALGRESRAKSTHVLLGPTINIHRSPLAGRGFEMFSEDPLLSGLVATEYVKGVQAEGVAATLKHFIGNEQEYKRFSSDSIIPNRALREIYLEPFRLVIQQADPKCLMAAYNLVNGTHMSENHHLLTEVLRKELGYKGLIMSDWTGTYSSAPSIKAGLDLEMPGPPTFRSKQTMRDIQCGKLLPENIDARAAEVLKLVNFAKGSGIPFDGPEGTLDDAETRRLLRIAAGKAVVLLKNDAQVLPITKAKTIAVIGGNARVAVVSGGGSAQMRTSFSTSPLAGITSAAKELGAEVTYAIGSLSYHFVPIATSYLVRQNGEVNGVTVADMDFWLEEPTADFKCAENLAAIFETPSFTLPVNTAFAFVTDGLPKHIMGAFPFIRYYTTFIPDQSGDWRLSVASIGSSNLYFEGKLLLANIENETWEAGSTFFGMGSKERTIVVAGLEKGKMYQVEVRSWARPAQRLSPVEIAGGIRIGVAPIVHESDAIAEAVKIAKEADKTIVIVGLNEDFESEGHDRNTLSLPGNTDDLVFAVLEACPDAIIVNQSGMPVLMPWAIKARAIVQAFYSGNDAGNGIADVLFGKVNPSSRLPVTFPKHLRDCVGGGLEFGATSSSDLKVYYQENVFIGYRHFDRADIVPLWPFGYGLSYSTFEFSSLDLSPVSLKGDFTVEFSVKNTSELAGDALGQVYVHQVDASVARPFKELKGFCRVHIEPGQREKVKLLLGRDAFKFWDDRGYGTWTAESGTYEVLVGPTSVDLPLKGTAVLEKSLTWIGMME